ncbi:MAG: hypothetical protein R2695_02230 [Acidimicrobiales bacterium]
MTDPEADDQARHADAHRARSTRRSRHGGRPRRHRARCQRPGRRPRCRSCRPEGTGDVAAPLWDVDSAATMLVPLVEAGLAGRRAAHHRPSGRRAPTRADLASPVHDARRDIAVLLVELRGLADSARPTP